MILFDTSIWVEFFKSKTAVPLKKENYELICICPPVFQEVLQGIKDDLAFRRLSERMDSLLFLDRIMPSTRYLEAAQLFRHARRRGITIRSSQDCLIAATALFHDVTVYHRDRDFSHLARFTNLKETTRFPF